MRALIRMRFAFAVLLAVACAGAEQLTALDPAVASLYLSPPSFWLRVGEERSLTVKRLGTLVAPTAVRWASSDTAVAQVSDAGVVHARRFGLATITVTSRVDSALAVSYITVP